jgi:hypothetical protein
MESMMITPHPEKYSRVSTKPGELWWPMWYYLESIGLMNLAATRYSLFLLAGFPLSRALGCHFPVVWDYPSNPAQPITKVSKRICIVINWSRSPYLLQFWTTANSMKFFASILIKRQPTVQSSGQNNMNFQVQNCKMQSADILSIMLFLRHALMSCVTGDYHCNVSVSLT